MPAYRDPDNGKWRYRKRVRLPDGKRVRIKGSPLVNTKAAAESAERERIERLLEEFRNPGSTEENRKEVPTLNAFKVEFMATYVMANNKPSERISKEYMFKLHLLPAFGRKRLDNIATRDIEKFKAKKLSAGLAPKTVNNMLSCLGKTLRYAAENEIIDKIPRVRFVKVFEKPIDFLDFDEYARLMEAAKADPESYPAILLGGDAGLRVGEIRSLKWEDLDLVARRVIVQRTDYRGYMGSPKGGRLRRLPMTKRLCAALKTARHLKGPWVFCDLDGKMWSRGLADTPLRRAYRKAGLRKIGWHTMRHTFCSHLAMRGAPVRTIQELAGHASLITTMRYMHLTETAAESAIDMLEQVGGPTRGPETGPEVGPRLRGVEEA
jgi:integrase